MKKIIVEKRNRTAHLVHFPRITVEAQSHFRYVRDDGLTPISTAFKFAIHSWHFVAVFGIINLVPTINGACVFGV